VEKCPGACKSDNYDGDIEGFVLNKEHNHQPQSMGASIRERMLCKGEKRARDQRDSIKTIIEDLEAEFLTVENVASVGWDRSAASQRFYRVRQQVFPKIPKNIEEFDSGEGMTTLQSASRQPSTPEF